jgi:Chaperonin 10 Kd subunit
LSSPLAALIRFTRRCPSAPTLPWVLFSKWSGTEIKLDGDELMIMKETDLMGIVVGNAGSKRRAA